MSKIDWLSSHCLILWQMPKHVDTVKDRATRFYLRGMYDCRDAGIMQHMTSMTNIAPRAKLVALALIKSQTRGWNS